MSPKYPNTLLDFCGGVPDLVTNLTLLLKPGQGYVLRKGRLYLFTHNTPYPLSTRMVLNKVIIREVNSHARERVKRRKHGRRRSKNK